MVVGQVVDARDAEADRLFHALADATRRDIVTKAGGAGYSVSQLAQHYPMSFAAVQKHVAVLQRAGLVTKERSGRQQIVRTSDAGLRRAQEILDDLESLWRGRVERMTTLLDPDTDPHPVPDSGPDQGPET